MSDIGYSAAIDGYINMVLQALMQQGQIGNIQMNAILSHRNTWENMFVNEASNYGEMGEEQFKQLLANFLIRWVRQNVSQNIGAGMYPGMGNTMVPGMNNNCMIPNMGNSMIDTTGYNNGYAPGFGSAPVSIHTTPTIYGGDPKPLKEQKIDTTNNKDITKSIKDNIIISSNSIPEGYEPPWIQDMELIKTENFSIDHIDFTILIYPGNDYSDGAILNDMASELFITNPSSVGKFTHMLQGDYKPVISCVNDHRVEVLPRSLKDGILEALKEIGELTTSCDNDIDVLRKIIKSTVNYKQGVYVFISDFILDMFNRGLKGRILQNSDTINADVEVSDLKMLLEFIPSAKNQKLKFLTQTPKYPYLFKALLKEIICGLNNINIIRPQHKECVLFTKAAAEQLGQEGLKYLIVMDKASSSDALNEAVKAFSEDHLILAYRRKYFNINDESALTPAMCEAIKSKSFKVIKEKTGDIDNIICRKCISTIPVPIYINGIVKLLISSLDDGTKIYCAV